MSGVKTYMDPHELRDFKNSTSAGGRTGRIVSGSAAGVSGTGQGRAHPAQQRVDDLLKAIEEPSSKADSPNTRTFFKKYTITDGVLTLNAHEFGEVIRRLKTAQKNYIEIVNSIHTIKIKDVYADIAEFDFSAPSSYDQIGLEFGNVCYLWDILKNGLISSLEGRSGKIFLTSFNEVLGTITVYGDHLAAINTLIPRRIETPTLQNDLPLSKEFMEQALYFSDGAHSNIGFCFKAANTLAALVNHESYRQTGFPVFIQIKKPLGAESGSRILEIGRLYSTKKPDDLSGVAIRGAMRDAQRHLGYISNTPEGDARGLLRDLFNGKTRLEIFCTEGYVETNPDDKCFVPPLAIFYPNRDLLNE